MPSWLKAVIIILTLVGIFHIFYTDIYKPFKCNYHLLDGSVFFSAGNCWHHHINPYDFSNLIKLADQTATLKTNLGAFASSAYKLPGPFFYPPQTSLLLCLVGSLNFRVASVIWTILNLGSMMASFFILSLLFQIKYSNERIFLIAVMFLVCPWIHTVILGQFTGIVFFSMLACWYIRYNTNINSLYKRQFIAGIFLAIASFKPQVSIAFFIWFLLSGELIIILNSMFFILLMSAPAMYAEGFLHCFDDWMLSLRHYTEYQGNSIDYFTRFGLECMLPNGFYRNGCISLPSFLFLLILLFINRHKMNNNLILSCLSSLSIIFIGHPHDVDTICFIPLFLTLGFLMKSSQSFITYMIALLLPFLLLNLDSHYYNWLGGFKNYLVIIPIIGVAILIKSILENVHRQEIELQQH